MSYLPEIAQALADMGLQHITRTDVVRAETNLLTFVATEGDGLRLECRLASDVQRTKVSLWNIVHHNNGFFPFGQFYISPADDVAFGLRLPPDFAYYDWLERILFELLNVAESYSKIIYNDFVPFPFHERDVASNFLLLERTPLRFDGRLQLVDLQAAGYMLERLLEDQLGVRNVVRMGEGEFAVADAYITTFTLEKLPYLRRHNYVTDWFIGLRTEVGIVEGMDNALWVLLNRLNYESCMLSYSIKYVQKKAILLLTSELPADCIQHPSMTLAVLQRHDAQAEWLYRSLHKSYRMQNIVDFNLGI